MFSYWRDSYNNLPRPIQRLGWWWVVPFGSLAIVLILLTLLPGPAMRIFTRIGPISSMLVLPCQFIAIGGYLFGASRLRRAFRASGGCLCTHCAHNVSGLGEQGNCPECGHWFNIETDRISWKAAKIELDRPR